MTTSPIVHELEELRLDSPPGKDKHFTAAARKSKYNMALGVRLIMLNVALGSVFFTDIVAEWMRRDGQRVVGGLLSFAAALLASLQAFMGFQKLVEGHRSVGNPYIFLSRRCRTLRVAAAEKAC